MHRHSVDKVTEKKATYIQQEEESCLCGGGSPKLARTTLWILYCFPRNHWSDYGAVFTLGFGRVLDAFGTVLTTPRFFGIKPRFTVVYRNLGFRARSPFFFYQTGP